MHQYLQDTEFATENLHRLATEEERKLRELTTVLVDMERQLKIHQWDFQSSDLNEDFSEAYVMAAFGRAARASQEVERLKHEVAAMQARVGTHQAAIQAIAGAILQIAKQGVALVHGGLTGSPPGRFLGSLAVRDIIWQGRNQSMHFEEGTFKKPVVDLFATLEAEQGPQFSLLPAAKQSRAKQVIDVLGWSGSYAQYLQDMQKLLPT